ncbi:aldehyde dehydrogenase family protein [Litoreibacter roseus]|uniref:Succinate-semialdehyde dehydrogenase n=1 Tax=Litoreibacter roseus TaxID=2601869 RepID=A0A6N6JD35_9RHOB|nr:aldehyde dehydrogenase family protein [Litoreibacter roseus]GFE63228.1 succinate-semialdehyde dehydrogenase [Litoreibacter roseus]
MAVSDIWTGSIYANQSHPGDVTFEVLDKYHLTPLTRVTTANATHIEEAMTLAERYGARVPSAYARYEILMRVRDLVAERRDRFQQVITSEAGFPINDANGEINRALQTLALSAEEAKRLAGDVIPFDGAPSGGGRIGFTLRVPLGTVVAITPFNAPLNTVCHKVGPAFAAGNAVILKPSDKTPLTSALLAECFAEAGAPNGAIAVLQGGVKVGQALLADPRPAFYAFTGSTAAGAAIHAAAGLRRTQMELGSIAGTIVMDDADIKDAAQKCVGASFRKAGQVCTSIQMLMVHETVLEDFKETFLAGAKALTVGNPAEPGVDVGPMISVAAAERVADLLKDEPLLIGGDRSNAVVSPTVINSPKTGTRALTEEIFGPVTCIIPIASLDDAVSRINATPYGLASGLFTDRIKDAFKAATQLKVGGIHINETSSSRVDLMPYGGTKASGFGHEGPKYAVREMSEERLVTFSGLRT